MRTALGLSLMLVAVGMAAGAEDEDWKPEPSPIPEKLQAEAKKAFAKKMVYFIWTEEKAGKAKDLKLKYAINPDQNGVKPHTVYKLTYTTKQGQKIPWTGITEGVGGAPTIEGKFKGTTDVSIYFIKATDVITPKGVNPNPEKAPAMTNTITVKLTFE